jgi:hypothetical protein
MNVPSTMKLTGTTSGPVVTMAMATPADGLASQQLEALPAGQVSQFPTDLVAHRTSRTFGLIRSSPAPTSARQGRRFFLFEQS